MDGGSAQADDTIERGSNYYRNQAKKRKRKLTLQNFKGSDRTGSCGRGAEMEPELYNYLMDILKAMPKQEDNEERQLMANNVLAQLEGKEIRSASNQLGSRVFENLLPFADEETFGKLMDTFAENFRVVCCDGFASYVLQRMLYVALLRAVAPLQNADASEAEPDMAKTGKNAKPFKRAKGAVKIKDEIWSFHKYSLEETYSDEHRQKCREFVERLAKFLINNLEEFLWNAKANYVVRQCILNMSGIAELKMVDSGKANPGTVAEAAPTESSKLVVPEKWQKILSELNLRIISWPQFVDLPCIDLTGLVLQVLLRALGSIGDEFQVEQLVSKLHFEVFRENNDVKKEEIVEEDNIEEGESDEKTENLPKVFKRDASTRVLEASISVASSNFLKEHIFEDIFRGHIQALAVSKAHNFALQRLIVHTKDKEMLEAVFDELEDCIENVLRVGNTGIVVALAKACARMGCQQGRFVKILLDALHCNDVSPEKMLFAFLYLLPANLTLEKTPRINLHGSLIIQAILEFNKPIKIVNALLEMPNERLATILSDQCGSFIANTFVESRFVGEKSREKMVRHLEGQYAQLMLTSHGSRVVDVMYDAGNPAQREGIVRELVENCPQLNSKIWGIAVNKRLLVDTYKRNPARWRIAIKSDAKVTKMFDKLIGGVKRKAENNE